MLLFENCYLDQRLVQYQLVLPPWWSTNNCEIQPRLLRCPHPYYLTLAPNFKTLRKVLYCSVWLCLNGSQIPLQHLAFFNIPSREAHEPSGYSLTAQLCIKAP